MQPLLSFHRERGKISWTSTVWWGVTVPPKADQRRKQWQTKRESDEREYGSDERESNSDDVEAIASSSPAERAPADEGDDVETHAS